MSDNQLQQSQSLHLKQHKDQPIHWKIWDKANFQKAEQENKLIFLSIGQSSCHWCHVMAGETFSNKEVAEYLNKHFICIKVDKDEFPDVDNHYQHLCQVFSQTGGWPLNAFLLPDSRPFFIGTYFPLYSSQNNVGFLDLIKEIKRTFDEQTETITDQAKKLKEAIDQGFEREHDQFKEGEFPGPNNIFHALKDYQENEFGGYGESPKFPQFAFYEWALDMMAEGHIEKEYGEHSIKTLKHMICGGVFDHLRGGIHPYSTDKLWLIPHFEKMAYDQAGFLATYVKLALFLPTPFLKQQLLKTIDYLEKEMTGDGNYFFASQDADSEGEEGLYFCYTYQEFLDALPEKLSETQKEKAIDYFNISKKGNYHSSLNVLSHPIDSFDLKAEELQAYTEIQTHLLEDRKQRIPPQTDTKGVASWNFLLLSSLCKVIIKSPWPELSHASFELLNKTKNSVQKEFTLKESNQYRFKHVTTLIKDQSYFEDYVFYLEFLFFYYQLNGQLETRNDILLLVKNINSTFIRDHKLYTRSIKEKDNTFSPNNEVPIFDQSFPSTSATYLNLLRRIHLLAPEEKYHLLTDKLLENVKGIVLKNPINSGEALRAFTYPWNAYFLVKVPLTFLENDLFQKIRRYAPARMLFDFTETEEHWQICSDNKCQDSGSGIKLLAEKLGIPL